MLPITTAPGRQETVVAVVPMMTVAIGVEMAVALAAVTPAVVIAIVFAAAVAVVGIISPQPSAQAEPMPHAVFCWRAFVDVRKQREGAGLAPYASWALRVAGDGDGHAVRQRLDAAA